MKTFEKETFRESFNKVKLLGKASAKAQSAMEYLMTYGWAILIIAVVLGALFELGVFNPMTFAPKAPPGACQVFRPNGPGTTSFINLEGICSGEIPQYVAQFNGQNSYISISSGPILNYKPVTLSAWAYPIGYQLGFILIKCNYMNSCDDGGYLRWYYGYAFDAQIANSSTGFDLIYGGAHGEPTNSWYYVVETYDGNTQKLYINGDLVASNTLSTTPVVTQGMFIGSSVWFGQNFNGSIANVQIYNTSLSANDIQALYQEGIGGAPINLQHLVGWWPLNGNANDYSGNGNNGQASNVIYVSNWYSSYTPP